MTEEPVRIREAADLAGCVAVLRRVHEVSGYPSRWPADPGGWITPRGLVAAWIAEHDGLIAGQVALVRGVRLECLLQATGLFPGGRGGMARLYVDPRARRRGLAQALLEAATDRAAAHGLQPVLEVVADSHPAIALYDRSGWQLAGTQHATWANPDGTTPVLRGYVRPRPVGSGPGRRKTAQLASPPRLIPNELLFCPGQPVRGHVAGYAGTSDTVGGPGNRYASCVRGCRTAPGTQGA